MKKKIKKYCYRDMYISFQADGEIARLLMGVNFDYGILALSEIEQGRLRTEAGIRATTYGIAIKSGGNLKPPYGRPLTDASYGDPVNYRFPINPQFRHETLTYFMLMENRDDYTVDEQITILTRILTETMSDGYGYVNYDENDPAFIGLADDLKDRLYKSEGGKSGVKDDGKFEASGRLIKAEIHKAEDGEEERLVYGVVLEPDTFDAHEDRMTSDTIRNAAHGFMEDAQKIGTMHEDFTKRYKILESYIAPVEMKIEGETVAKGSWVMGVRVLDNDVWKAVQDGDITGFSIGGYAYREPVQED